MKKALLLNLPGATPATVRLSVRTVPSDGTNPVSRRYSGYLVADTHQMRFDSLQFDVVIQGMDYLLLVSIRMISAPIPDTVHSHANSAAMS